MMDDDRTVLLTELDFEVPDEGRRKVLSRFAQVKMIGEGGMGVVYYGFDSLLERHVAIKFVDRQKMMTLPREQEVQFRQECRAMARLRHLNVPTIFEAGESEGAPYFIMEYVEGGSLKDIIYAESQRPISEKRSILIQVGEALKHAHSQGIVHRDVKPDNIMIMPGGLAKLVDFGISKTIHHKRPLTRDTDYVKGSPFYMCPEQMLFKEVDHRADLFSFAVVCYELLASRHPFFPNPNSRPGQFTKIRDIILNTTPQPLRSLMGIDLDDSLIAQRALDALSMTLSFCLENDPSERPSRIDDLLNDLKQLHQSLLKKSPVTLTLIKQMVNKRPPLLDDFTAQDMKKMLSSARVRTLRDGEIIFHEGDREARFYIVSNGQVAIFRVRDGREIILNTLGLGDCFGEMAFLDDSPRMAAARAIGSTALFAVDQEVLKDKNVSFAAKLYRNLAIILAEKLRMAEDRLLLEAGMSSVTMGGSKRF
ncbi:MAG: protein kinase [Deltaproteobacteria bacterium]|nr:protein kinase [Deltaproteobacteria bacterium]